MDIRLSLDHKLVQKLVMTPQLQQAIKLLQLSHLELSQTINQELVENPILEDTAENTQELSAEEKKEEARKEALTKEAETKQDEKLLDSSEFDYKWDEYVNENGDGRDLGYISNEGGGGGDDFPSIDQVLSKSTSLLAHLLWQLNLSSSNTDQKEIGAIIIGNIDDDGYLRSSNYELSQITGIGEDVIEECILIIQEFDPPGVCARNLQECLVNQIKGMDLGDPVMIEMVNNHLDDLVKKNYHNISKSLNVSLDDVYHAAKILEGLEPKPGRPFSNLDNNYITPDAYIRKNDKGEYVVSLNDDGMPKLKINSYYKKLLNKGESESENTTKDYLEGKFKSALWLIRSIDQRNKTICKVIESIIKFQKDFLDHGYVNLKPLILKQVADDIEMHESTISRVTANKFVHTPQGIFELKFFFNSNIPRTNDLQGGLSSITVREMIRKLILEEDSVKPLKDQEIYNYFKNKNINIARRTIAKYRSELNIPPASRRKKFY